MSIFLTYKLTIIMPDLYLLLTPFFAFLSLLTLLNLKFALAEPEHQDLSKYHQKSLSKYDKPQQTINGSKSADESAYFKTLKYLLKNFTLLQFCLIRRSKNKIPLLFSISGLAVSTLFIKNQFIFIQTCLGFLTATFYVLVKMMVLAKDIFEHNQFKKDKKKSKFRLDQKNGQKLEIIMTSIILLTNLTIIWLLYKNTNNSQIFSSIYIFLIIFAIDNLLIKPLMLSLVAFPLKLWSFTHVFIEKQSQIIQILREQRVLKKQAKQGKRVFAIKRVNNTTSNTQNTIEIQPCVNYELHVDVENQKIENKDVSKCSFVYKKSSGKLQQSESSLVKYINYPFKNIQPNTVGSKVCNLRKIEIDQKIINENSFGKNEYVETSSIKRKRNKLYSQKNGSIPQFIYDESGLPKNTQNQQQDDSHLQTEEFIPMSFLTANRSLTSRHNESAKKQSENQLNHQSYERKTLYHSNQRPNLILETQIFNNSCVSGFNYTAKTDLLNIREDKHAEDLEQIDMNSPERYKNQMRKLHVKPDQQRKMNYNHNEENLKIGVTKFFKNYSIDPNNQIIQKVIQNRNHQIYSIQKEKINDLQDGSNRRKTFNRTSQINLSRKSDIFTRFSNDSRIAKSVKRTKNNKDPIVRQNDENRIPEFVIQDFIY